ncbi:type III pantothenate kinase [Phorcysia thermohydrogeniphila]|uniref:Type III pantothenate kinase n=1 Tax=Phorcysia thermohydrogeniphila TaxID=936138 RepID=A0A4R1GCH6_9BACT|nr:type III pantothenate kinase [Phorcysia thermohydrogeniphila]TCK03379.1 type III pantothenate kinase [Phorcysia thermohydrogeniphila]
MRSLLIDAGNTSVKVALFEDGTLQPLFRIPTIRVLEHPADFVKKLRDITFNKLGVASVVKEITHLIEENFPGALIVSANLKLPIKIDYRTPELLGADRIAAACGGLEFADSFIVVSCGTATVVDLVEEKTFKGGVIFPGVETMAQLLNLKTSQLPKVNFEGEVKIPGRSTEECIQAGILASTIGGIKETIRNLPQHPLLITGGWGELVSRHVKGTYVPELVFKGILKILK